jgi:hypothetical protein
MAALHRLPLLLVLAGCTPPYDAPIMYQAVTPDCATWVDGSGFELPGEINVFAGKPAPAGKEAWDLDLAYFLPRKTEARFATQDFVLNLPHGDVVAKGEVVKVERALPGARRARESLPLRLDLLRGEDFDDDTMVQVTIRFHKPLPQRFDFTPPSMIVAGRTYPVRTYTYRWFASRNALGLCS